MNKIAYNACYGGFSLSKKAIERLIELGMSSLQECLDLNKDTNYKYYYTPDLDKERHNPLLIQVIEELGEEANGQSAKLKIAEIYGDVYKINEYDGKESVVELDLDYSEWIMIK